MEEGKHWNEMVFKPNMIEEKYHKRSKIARVKEQKSSLIILLVLLTKHTTI